jgi:hypothetical protein
MGCLDKLDNQHTHRYGNVLQSGKSNRMEIPRMFDVHFINDGPKSRIFISCFMQLMMFIASQRYNRWNLNEYESNDIIICIM